MTRTFAAGWLAVACVTGALAAEPLRRLTLDEAESAALAHHERIQVAAAEQHRAAIGSWRAATLVAPSVAETASYEHPKDEIAFPTGETASGQGFNPVILQENATRSTLTVTQPLFRGQFSSTRELGRIDVSRSAEGTRAAEDDVRLEVATAYYRALRAAALATVADEALSLSRIEVEHAKARVYAGEAANSDVVRAETEITEATQQVAEANGALEIARRQLARACGIDDPVELVEPPEPSIDVSSAAPLVTRALAENPEIRRAALEVDAARAEESRRRAALYPTLDARFQYHLVDNESFVERNDFWSAGVALEIPVFEAGGARWLDLEEQKARVTAAAAEYRRLAKDLELAVDEAQISARTLEFRESAAAESERLAIETHREVSEQYAAGEATSVDVLSALTARNRARATLATVRYDRRLALERLRRLTGDPSEGRTP